MVIEYPSAWEIEASEDHEGNREHDSDREDDEEDEEEDSEEPRPAANGSTPKKSAAFSDLLQFLELGCAGMPVQGYPTVLIILTTIPTSVRFIPSRGFH